MASVSEPTIEELNRQSARLEAETRKLMAEAQKLSAEQLKLSAEQQKLQRDKALSPWLLLAQGLIGGAALLGGALALLKYLAA